MAVKQSEKNTAASAAPAGNAAPNTGNGEAQAVQAPKRRGRAKGQAVGPRLNWDKNDRDTVLASILKRGYTKQEDGTWVKDENYSGSTKTATSVAEALASHPAFADAEAPVTPARVKSHLDSVVASREKAGLPVHEWLALTLSRSRIKAEAYD
jgi:hypothetical protein